MMTRTHIVAFILSLLVSAVSTPLIRKYARKHNLMDSPEDPRKVHRTPTPRLGGIAIALGFWSPLVALLVYSNDISTILFAEPMAMAGIGLGSMAILAVGVWDDLRGMAARHKLLAQVLISLGMVAVGFQIDRVNLPIWGTIEMGEGVGIAVTVLWFVGIMNAINLIDGLDGLAGGVAFFAVVTLFSVTLMDQDVNLLTTLFCCALGGAVVGFLFYNFNPATIFMGDGGSLFLGFIIATVGVHTQAKSNTALALTVCVLALGLPILDTALSILRRLSRGKDPFSADREHIHHRLLAIGLTPKQAALVLYGFCSFLGLFAVALKVQGENDIRYLLILIALGVTITALSQMFRFRELVFQKNFVRLHPQRVTPEEGIHLKVRGLAKTIRNAEDLDTVWSCVEKAAISLHVQDVQLECVEGKKTREGIRKKFHRDEPEFSRLPKTTKRIDLAGQGHLRGAIRWNCRMVRTEEEEQRIRFIEILSEALSEWLDLHLSGTSGDRKSDH